MLYAAFKVTDEKGVNAFLKENKQKIAKDGVAFVDGHICILYEERSPEQTERDLAVDAAQVFINGKISQVIGHEVDARSWRTLALEGKGGKNADVEIGIAESKRDNLLINVKHARDIMHEIKNKKFAGMTG